MLFILASFDEYTGCLKFNYLILKLNIKPNNWCTSLKFRRKCFSWWKILFKKNSWKFSRWMTLLTRWEKGKSIKNTKLPAIEHLFCAIYSASTFWIWTTWSLAQIEKDCVALIALRMDFMHTRRNIVVRC